VVELEATTAGAAGFDNEDQAKHPSGAAVKSWPVWLVNWVWFIGV
jgi:hypothetical protein